MGNHPTAQFSPHPPYPHPHPHPHPNQAREREAAQRLLLGVVQAIEPAGLRRLASVPAMAVAAAGPGGLKVKPAHPRLPTMQALDNERGVQLWLSRLTGPNRVAALSAQGRACAGGRPDAPCTNPTAKCGAVMCTVHRMLPLRRSAAFALGGDDKCEALCTKFWEGVSPAALAQAILHGTAEAGSAQFVTVLAGLFAPGATAAQRRAGQGFGQLLRTVMCSWLSREEGGCNAAGRALAALRGALAAGERAADTAADATLALFACLRSSSTQLPAVAAGGSVEEAGGEEDEEVGDDGGDEEAGGEQEEQDSPRKQFGYDRVHFWLEPGSSAEQLPPGPLDVVVQVMCALLACCPPDLHPGLRRRTARALATLQQAALGACQGRRHASEAAALRLRDSVDGAAVAEAVRVALSTPAGDLHDRLAGRLHQAVGPSLMGKLPPMLRVMDARLRWKADPGGVERVFAASHALTRFDGSVRDELLVATCRREDEFSKALTFARWYQGPMRTQTLLTLLEAQTHLTAGLVYASVSHGEVGAVERAVQEAQREWGRARGSGSSGMAAGQTRSGGYTYGQLPTELRTLCGAFHQLALELVIELAARPGRDVGGLARPLLQRLAELPGGGVWLQMGAQQLLLLAPSLLPSSRRAGGLAGPHVGRWMCDEMDPALLYKSLWYNALLAHANACREFQPNGVVAFSRLSCASLYTLGFHRAPACLAWHAATQTAVLGASRSGTVSVAEALRARDGWIVAQTNDARWLHGLESEAQTQAGPVHAQRIVVLLREPAERARSLAALLLSWAARPEMAAVLQQFLGPAEEAAVGSGWSQEDVLQQLTHRAPLLRAEPATAPLLQPNDAYKEAGMAVAPWAGATVQYVWHSADLGADLGAALGIAGLALPRLHSSGIEVPPPRSIGRSGAHATHLCTPPHTPSHCSSRARRPVRRWSTSSLPPLTGTCRPAAPYSFYHRFSPVGGCAAPPLPALDALPY